MDMLTLRRIAARAVKAGGTIHSRYLVEWDISGRCRASVTRELSARTQIPRDQQDQRTWHSDASGAGIYRVILHTRCRKCDMCLRHRGNHWRDLCQRELLTAQRTWFLTLTFTPDEHFRYHQRAVARLAAMGTNYDKLHEDPEKNLLAQFIERDREIYPDIQRFIKRMRKATGCKFRYFVAGEIHTEKLRGYPHYHVLIHEVIGSRPLTKRAIQGQWPYGFTQCKLVEDTSSHAHWYVTKYLTKEASTRVRASFRYGMGTTPLRHSENGVEGGKGETVSQKEKRCPPIHVETTFSVNGTTYPLVLETFGDKTVVSDIRDTLGPPRRE